MVAARLGVAEGAGVREGVGDTRTGEGSAVGTGASAVGMPGMDLGVLIGVVVGMGVVVIVSVRCETRMDIVAGVDESEHAASKPMAARYTRLVQSVLWNVVRGFATIER